MGTVTAKIVCTGKLKSDWGTSLEFGADYQDGRNAEWAEATPSLSLTMTVKHGVAAHFDLGAPFTLTFEPSNETEDVATPNARSYHPAVADVLRHFAWDHLPKHLQTVSRPFAELAHQLADTLSGPQLTIGLQDLLRAKDACVRAAVRPQASSTS